MIFRVATFFYLLCILVGPALIFFVIIDWCRGWNLYKKLGWRDRGQFAVAVIFFMYITVNYIDEHSFRLMYWASQFLVETPPALMVKGPPIIESYEKRSDVIKFFNQPYKTSLDIVKMNNSCSSAVTSQQNSGTSSDSDGASRGNFDLYKWATAMTSLTRVPGEYVGIAPFANSTDAGLQKLQYTVGLPPPEGGVILRIYERRDSIPVAILPTLPYGLDSAAIFGRYIVICSEGMTTEELNGTISRRLVECYINSYGGVRSYQLPDWFINGAALYLSTPSAESYVFEAGRRPNSVSEYNLLSLEEREYHSVYRYLSEKRLGWFGLIAFIRQSVEDGSTEPSMMKAFRSSSYDALKENMLGWKKSANINFGITILIILAVFSFLVYLMWDCLNGWKILTSWGLYFNLGLVTAEDDVSDKADLMMIELELFEKDSGTLDKETYLERTLEMEGKFEDLALSMAQQAYFLVKAYKNTEAEWKLNAAAHLVPWSSLVNSEIEKARKLKTKPDRGKT